MVQILVKPPGTVISFNMADMIVSLGPLQRFQWKPTKADSFH